MAGNLKQANCLMRGQSGVLNEVGDRGATLEIELLPKHTKAQDAIAMGACWA